MMFKTVFVALACSTVVLGFNVNPRMKRHGNIEHISPNDALESVGSSPMGTASNYFSKGASISSGIQPGSEMFSAINKGSEIASIPDFGKKIQTAVKDTYQEEKNSVSDSWNNIKNLFHQSIETNANLTKTAFDFGTVVPKLGKNFILSN